MRQDQEQATVTPLELFFDLVFVFALTQVTAFMADELSWHGILRGALVMMLLWWAWTAYAWLANVASAEERPIQLAILAGMAAMFVLALCIPEAFDDLPGGLSGPVVLAVCYLLFRAMHLVMYLIISREDAGFRRQVLRFALSVAASSVLLLVASQFQGWPQTVLWMLALLADYVGTALGGFRGWRLPSPGHFSERHGLIIIIALGESIVAIGVGVAKEPITWVIIAASVLGLLLASALWWAYFDVSALLGENALVNEPPETRARLARNAYSFAHLPLMLGIVLVAFGLKEVLLYVSDSSEHSLTDPLPSVALAALRRRRRHLSAGPCGLQVAHRAHSVGGTPGGGGCAIAHHSLDRRDTGTGPTGRRGVRCGVCRAGRVCALRGVPAQDPGRAVPSLTRANCAQEKALSPVSACPMTS